MQTKFLGFWSEELMAIGLFFNARFWSFGETTADFLPTIGIICICICIYWNTVCWNFDWSHIHFSNFRWQLSCRRNGAVVAKGWVYWNSKSTRCAGSRMPGQLKWVFCETPSSQVGKNFLLKLYTRFRDRGGESDPRVLCSKRVGKTCSKGFGVRLRVWCFGKSLEYPNR